MKRLLTVVTFPFSLCIYRRSVRNLLPIALVTVPLYGTIGSALLPKADGVVAGTASDSLSESASVTPSEDTSTFCNDLAQRVWSRVNREHFQPYGKTAPIVYANPSMPTAEDKCNLSTDDLEQDGI